MSDALRAVANPTRRAILRLVNQQELSAGEIAEHFPEISRPAVSQHLRVLSESGLVETRADGNRRLYRGRPEGMSEVSAFLEDMWSDKLSRLKNAAERDEWPDRTRTAQRAARSNKSNKKERK